MPLDVVHSVGGVEPVTWDLSHGGVDLVTALPCDCLPLGRIFEGTLLQSAGLPLTMVRGGQRLQFALAAPALRLARSSYDVPPAVFGAIPYGASMAASADVIGAPDRPAAFLLDDARLWPRSRPSPSVCGRVSDRRRGRRRDREETRGPMIGTGRALCPQHGVDRHRWCARPPGDGMCGLAPGRDAGWPDAR